MDILEKQSSLNEENDAIERDNVISIGHNSENVNRKTDTFSKDEDIGVPAENSISSQDQQITDNSVPQTNSKVERLPENNQINITEKTETSLTNSDNKNHRYSIYSFKNYIKNRDIPPYVISDKKQEINQEKTDTKLSFIPIKKKVISEEAMEIRKHFREREKEGIHIIYNYKKEGVIINRRVGGISQLSEYCIDIPVLADAVGTTDIPYVHRMIKKCEKVMNKTFMFKNEVKYELIRNNSCSLNEGQGKKFANQKKGFLTIEGFFLVYNYIKAHERL